MSRRLRKAVLPPAVLPPAVLLPAVLLVAVLLVAGCAGPAHRPAAARPTAAPSRSSSPAAAPAPSATGAPAPAAPPAPLVVTIRHFAFVPQNPTVAVGQRIVIVNTDVAAHTWSAAPKSGWSYTTGNLERGQRATFGGFPRPGRYRLLCFYHAEMPAMTGTVTVH